MEAGGGWCKPFLRWVLFMVGLFCQGGGQWKRARTQLQKEMGFLLIVKNKTNKNYPVGEKQTGQGRTRLDWADRAGHKACIKLRRTTYGNEPTRNCKHKEIIKGANEESNEGEQLGKINQ